MTPEQMREAWKLIDAWRAAKERGFPGTIVDAEKEVSAFLAQFVRVPPPRPPAERRCGMCVHYGMCTSAAFEFSDHETSFAESCRHYSESGALPEGIAAVIRRAVAVERSRAAMDEDALFTDVRNLSDAELAMAGVEPKEPESSVGLSRARTRCRVADLRPLHRVLAAIEAWELASVKDPDTYNRRGPTAKAVDKMLGLDEGRTRSLVYAVADRGFVQSLPPWRGAAQRLSLTDAGRAFLAAGCPLQLRGRGADG